jgi:hypothetical protein
LNKPIWCCEDVADHATERRSSVATTESSSQRLNDIHDRVDEVFDRLYRLRKRIRLLSREMDEQLEETKATGRMMDEICGRVECLRIETYQFQEECRRLEIGYYY